jgi:hypothetical protein
MLRILKASYLASLRPEAREKLVEEGLSLSSLGAPISRPGLNKPF